MAHNRGDRKQQHNQPSFLVPNDTKAVLQNNINRCENMGLILARYVSEQAIKDEKGKGPWLRDQARNYQINNRLVNVTYQRWQATTVNAEHFEARSLGRLVVGLGGESVLETSLTLQFVTGLPIIPGSALKGLCRHYALFTIAAKLDIKPLTASALREHKGLTPLQQLDEALISQEWSSDLVTKLERADQLEVAEMFRAIFGSTDYGGVCIFYEAVVSTLSQSGTLFEVDVMTPHFPDYYTSNGSKPPSDDQSPRPINFLAVAAGIEFAFAVGLRRRYEDQREYAQQATSWLKDALYEMGIGAKTAAGYGVFEKAK